MKTLPTSSIRDRRSLRIAFWGLLAVLSAVLSLSLGAVSIAPSQVLQALLGQLEGTPQAQIVLFSRLPRTCGCLLAGAALAMAGVVIQSVLHNPLAAPNIIGVNSGAGLMVAICCAAAPAAVWAVPFTAFAGALLGTLLVFLIAQRTGASRITLVLSGIAISGMFSAGIDAVVTLFPDALNGYSDFRIGGFDNLPMSRILPAVWVILPAMAAVLLLCGEMDILSLGDETARSLGLPVGRIRLLLLALAAALAGGAVSFAGLLGFVGLVVPHMMRRLVGEESLPLLLGSAFGGAALVTLCDIATRLLFAPYVLPVGIVLSLCGGGFFLWLLTRRKGDAHG